MPFSGTVRTQWFDDGLRMVVLDPLLYVDSKRREWRVPSGFITDGASIPRELWSLIGSPFTGKYRVAAIFHDAAYSDLGVAKDDADRMLREASIELGCPTWLANTLYEGVRLGGLGAYAEDQRKSADVLST